MNCMTRPTIVDDDDNDDGNENDSDSDDDDDDNGALNKWVLIVSERRVNGCIHSLCSRRTTA